MEIDYIKSPFENGKPYIKQLTFQLSDLKFVDYHLAMEPKIKFKTEYPKYYKSQIYAYVMRECLVDIANTDIKDLLFKRFVLGYDYSIFGHERSFVHYVETPFSYKGKRNKEQMDQALKEQIELHKEKYKERLGNFQHELLATLNEELKSVVSDYNTVYLQETNDFLCNYESMYPLLKGLQPEDSIYEEIREYADNMNGLLVLMQDFINKIREYQEKVSDLKKQVQQYHTQKMIELYPEYNELPDIVQFYVKTPRSTGIGNAMG